jgi:uncharacterized protein YdhG (YjbR/CyaY superfamily)
MKIIKATTVEEYLAEVPEPAQSTLRKLRESIRKAAPKSATEKLSYGMPAFYDDGPLVAYAAFTDHCSFFPMSGSVVEELEKDLKDYKTSKGTIQFGVDKPLPASLVKKLVETRLEQKARKEKKKAVPKKRR